MLFEVAVILALIALNAVLAGAEIAVVSVRKTRIHELVREGRGRARAVDALRQQPERFFATVQIGITVVGATAGAFGGATLARDLTGLLASAGLEGALAVDAAFVVVVGGIAYLTLVLGELVPKSLALRNAERYALFIGRPLLALSLVARPVVWLLTWSSNLILRLFGDRTTFTEARLSPEELQELVEEAGETGSLDPRAAEIASRAFDFGGLRLSAVMVPRQDIVGIPRHAAAAEVRRILLEQGHSRMPVFEGDLDHIVGYVIAKDVLALSWEKDLLVLEDILRPVHFIPEAAKALSALKDMQSRGIQLAMVVDEEASISGLVTIEDLVEELVGDILSEHERPRDFITIEPDGTALVSGTTPIREVNRALDLELPEGASWSTMAGLCNELAGWIPTAGTRLTSPEGTTLEIVESSPRRVRVVRVHRRT